MFSSLRSRLWLSYALLVVTALSVVAIILFVYLIRNPFLYRQTLERLQAVQTVVMERDGQPISTVAARASKTFNVRILLFSADQQVLLDTYAKKDSALSFPKQKLLPRSTPIIRDEKKAAWLYSIAKLPDNTYIMVAVPRPRVSLTNVFTDDLLPLIIQSGVIALLLSLVVAFLFARWIADPLQNVVLAARQMPSAEIKPVEPQGPHEVQELTRAFNGMILRTQASQKSQREFVANVSHELKTPLALIRMYAETLYLRRVTDEERQHQYHRVLLHEAERLSQMINTVLDFSRLSQGIALYRLTETDLRGTVANVLDSYRWRFDDEGLRLESSLQEALPAVAHDPHGITQILINLIDNAVKYAAAGGMVKVSLRVAGDNVELVVADHGPGIPEEDRERVRKPFQRGKEADPASGSGLGLALVEQIATIHHAHLQLNVPADGKGLEAVVCFPIYKDAS